MAPEFPQDKFALPEPQPDWALFLDVDGTLVDIAATPDAVTVPAGLNDLLAEINAVLGGAVALVSGRSIANIEGLLGPQPTAIAGLHGLEIRQANESQVVRSTVPPGHLDAAREALQAFVSTQPGLALEDKELTLAVHYRAVPGCQGAVEAKVADLADQSGGTLHAVAGKMVVELKPLGIHKGTAVEALMATPPFQGRRALFAGDDVTDEDGFAAANRLGGISIRIGAAAAVTQARWSCASVAEFGQWLAKIPQTVARG